MAFAGAGVGGKIGQTFRERIVIFCQNLVRTCQPEAMRDVMHLLERTKRLIDCKNQPFGWERLMQIFHAAYGDGVSAEALIFRASHEDGRKIEAGRVEVAGQLNTRHGTKLNIRKQA